MAVSRLLNKKSHQLPVLWLVPGYVHPTLHLALALLHDMSYVPVVLRQVCYLHCPYYFHTFIILFSGQGHNNQAAVESTRVVLHSRNLTANVLYLGMWHEDILLGVKLASSSPPLELIPCPSFILEHLQSQESYYGNVPCSLLVWCQTRENHLGEGYKCDRHFLYSLNHFFSLEMRSRLFNCSSPGSCSTLFYHLCHHSLLLSWAVKQSSLFHAFLQVSKHKTWKTCLQRNPP